MPPPPSERCPSETLPKAAVLARAVKCPSETLPKAAMRRSAFPSSSSAFGPAAVAAAAPTSDSAELMKAWDEELRGLVSQGDAEADRAVANVLERARRGEPCSPGLPALSIEEARVKLIRCGAQAALDRDREQRVAARIRAAGEAAKALTRG